MRRAEIGRGIAHTGYQLRRALDIAGRESSATCLPSPAASWLDSARQGLTGRFGVRALRNIGHFYDDHREVIEQHRECALGFTTGQPAQRRVTRANVIDEIFYIEGRGRVTAL